MDEFFYADLFIKQMQKFLKVKDRVAEVWYDYPRVVINPLSMEVMNEAPSIMIHDIACLDEILDEYWSVVQKVDIDFTKVNQYHQLKYFLSNVWRNATNYDYNHPEEFFMRMTSFIEDKTFQEFDGSILAGNFMNDNIFITRKQARRGFETPYELSFSILTKDFSKEELPVIRYGILEDEIGVKKAYLYAIQNEQDRISKELERKWKDMNATISGMENRGVHSRAFLLSIAISLGLFQAAGVEEILVNDFQISRFYTLNRYLKDYEHTSRIQQTITNKFLKTMLRMEYEFLNLSAVSYPNDIDNFLHMRIGGNLVTENVLLQEAYQLGLSAYKNNTDKQLIIKK